MDLHEDCAEDVDRFRIVQNVVFLAGLVEHHGNAGVIEVGIPES